MMRNRSGFIGKLFLALQLIGIANASDLPTPDDLRVRDLDKVVQAFAQFPGRMYAGSLPMDHASDTPGANPNGERTGFLQFWLFVPDEIAAKDTMVAWFNGGPGCSSFSAGVMFEHSPVTVPLNPAGWCCEEADAPLGYNKYGWTNATVMLYVEQPIGVGFSEATNDTPEPSSEDDVAADFDSFLQNFYKVFAGYETPDADYDPKLDLTTHKLNLVGESYAGTYIPSVARGIYRNNVKELVNHDGSPRFQTPLSGIAIGNGKIDSITQDPAIIDYAYWHGLIDMGTRDYLYAEWEHCLENMKHGIMGKGAEPKHFHPFNVRDDCGVFNQMLQAAGAGALESLMGGPNIYEYSTWDAYAAADGDDGTVSKFYNNLDVQTALNVPLHRQGPGHHWAGCIPEVEYNDDDGVGERRLAASEPTDFEVVVAGLTGNPPPRGDQRRRLFMDNDTPWSVTPYIAELLDDAKIDVLIYSGDRDIICCTQGSEEALRKMDWSGTRDLAPSNQKATPTRNAWTEADRGLWLYEDYPAGYTKAYKNLNLLTIYNAGHMVPYNQPGPALDMLTRFLKGEDFYDRPLVSYASVPFPEKGPVSAASSESPKQFNTAENLQQSLLGESEVPTLHGFSGSSVLGTVVLSACTAFVLGVVVAHKTMAAPEVQIKASSSEFKPLKEGDGYGSVANL